MKNEIKELLLKRAKEVNNYSAYEFDIRGTDEEVNITVECMYSLGGFISFGLLTEISELLDTKSIDLEDEHHTPGCDTCDYGSCSSATIVVKDINYKGEIK